MYGSIAVVGLGIAWWGLRVLGETRSVRVCLAHPPLFAAGLGALGALAAAPVDAIWHEAYGRDAVLWSPPHMLVVLASTALVLGALSGLPPQARALRAAVGVLMLANAAAVVFEYEADVPQFSEVFYLPVLLSVGLASVWLVREVVPVRLPATTVVLWYSVLRLGIMGALVALGRSTPDLPVAVLGLAAFDLPLGRTSARLAAAAVATSILTWLASAGSLASPVASEVAVTALPVLVVGTVVLLAASRRGLWATPPLLIGAALLLAAPPDPAQAHDPGQGDPLTRLELTVTSDGEGHITLLATVGEHCEDLAPGSVLARRAGETVTGAAAARDRVPLRGRTHRPDRGSVVRLCRVRPCRRPGGDVVTGGRRLQAPSRRDAGTARPAEEAERPGCNSCPVFSSTSSGWPSWPSGCARRAHGASRTGSARAACRC